MEENIAVAAQAPYMQQVSVGLPTAFKYNAETFYVRECYTTYYEWVIQLLKEYDYISVTGTPGIGKSIFFDYFFSRYRKSHPDVSIVTASFNKDRQLEECVVFGPNDSSAPPIFDAVSFARLQNEFPNAIHLYDGPPSVKPARSKMVAFTSPNNGWFESMHKNPAHCQLYMPVWTLKELRLAVYWLSLNIASEDVAKRFKLFGGIPRYCLTLDSRFYDMGVSKLLEGVDKIKSFQDVKDCFTMNNLPLGRVVHRLLHYYPVSDATKASLQIASNEICIMIHNGLTTRLSEERKKLRKWLDGVGKGSTFSSWLFEGVAHEKLLEGGRFSCRKLGESGVTLLTINRTIGTYERFASDFTLEMVFENIYEIPDSQTFKSVDSFIYSRQSNLLLLFQITTSAHHPVKSAGLIELFSKLKILDRVKEGTTAVQLIFVVPVGMGESYKRQDLTHGKSHCTDLAHLEVDNIDDIGQKKKQKLNELGISNCLDLISMHNAGDKRISFVNAAVEKFKQQLTMLEDLSYLERISQYVMELKE